MARVLEYKDGKMYIRDLKMGRSWRMPEERVGREGRKKEGKRKEEGRLKSTGALSEKEEKV